MSNPPRVRADGDTNVHDDTHVHIVGFVQHWLDRLQLKIPRALCGVSLEGDPGKPGPGPDAPVCPDCAALEAWPWRRWTS